jgi:hypothetical protein
MLLSDGRGLLLIVGTGASAMGAAKSIEDVDWYHEWTFILHTLGIYTTVSSIQHDNMMIFSIAVALVDIVKVTIVTAVALDKQATSYMLLV